MHLSKTIQIRHVPAALHKTLTARAARAGMTLSDYIKAELERSVQQLTGEEIRERLAKLERITVRESSASVIRRERDSR